MALYSIVLPKWRKHEDANLFWAHPTPFIQLRIEEIEYDNGLLAYGWSIKVAGSSGLWASGETSTILNAKKLAEEDYVNIIVKPMLQEEF